MLDDVFSEFDEDKRLYLNAVIKEYQSVITTALPLSELPPEYRRSNHVELSRGKLKTAK